MGTTLCYREWVSHCGGFSHFRAQALELGLRSCGAWNMWNPAGPGIELVSSLAGRFPSTEPTREVLDSLF